MINIMRYIYLSRPERKWDLKYLSISRIYLMLTPYRHIFLRYAIWKSVFMSHGTYIYQLSLSTISLYTLNIHLVLLLYVLRVFRSTVKQLRLARMLLDISVEMKAQCRLHSRVDPCIMWAILERLVWLTVDCMYMHVIV